MVGAARCLVLLVLGLLTASPAPAQQADGVARAEMVRLVELEVLSLSSLTGVDAVASPILGAMRDVPRHLFVPVPLRPYAYRNHPLPIGHEQNIAAPLLVALMTHLLDVDGDDVVFETGTGAGYHAAVLAVLVDRVYSVEVVEPLAREAARTLDKLGYGNVSIRAGDGYYGWRERGPFDAMLIKEALDHVPPPLLGQLKRGGRMVIPLGPERGPQFLTVVRKDENGDVDEERIMPVRFSPLQGGQRL